MTQQQILKTQADAMGITPDQLQKIMDATSTPTGPGSQIRTQNYGGIGYAQPQQGQVSDYQNIVDTLTAYKQAGLSVEPPPPQQPQQQGPSLQDMWNAYMQKGAQQAPAQQPATAATIAPITPYRGQQWGTATPYASIAPVQSPSLFAPPPPPAPGQQPQQQWQQPQQQQQQWPQIQRFQQGGPVLPQNQNPQQQGYISGDYNQGLSNSENYLNYLGSLGGSVVINPRPNQGQMGQGSLVGPTGVYTGPQQATVYGSDRGMPTPSIVPGSLGQYTFPNGGQLTQAQMAQFMQGTPDEQALVASGLGTTPQAIIQAAQTYQGTTQGGVPFSVQNAPIQRVTPMAGGGAPAVTPGLGYAATMPTPSGGGQPNITPMMPANAAGYRPLGPSGMPLGGQPFATVSAPGQIPIPPSSVTPPPMMMSGGGMFGMGGMGQPPSAPGGVANYAAGGVGIPQIMEAHNDALAKTGMAFYAHMTGEDPKIATPGQVADFQNQFMAQVQAHIGALAGNAATPGGSAAGGAATALGTGATGAPPAKKMATGGLVPGRGNTDKVPALLTPGEYVLNRQQTAQLFGRRTPIRMATGGPVPDDNEPPEVRRQPLTVPTATNQQATPQTQPGPSQTSSASTPAPDDQSHPGYPSAAAGRAALMSGGASGGGYNIPASLGGGYIGASPGTGQSGYAYPSQAAATAAGDVGTGVTGGGPLSQKQGDAIQGVISGLVSAAKTYADSFKEWKPVAQAFGGPSAAPSEPVTQFRQERVS